MDIVGKYTPGWYQEPVISRQKYEALSDLDVLERKLEKLCKSGELTEIQEEIAEELREQIRELEADIEEMK